MRRLALITSLSLIIALGANASFGEEQTAEQSGQQPTQAPAENEAKPDPKNQPKQRPYLGIMPSRNTDEGSGIPIARVFPNSTAASLGMQNGDRILAINDHMVNTTQEVSTVLQGLPVGDKITIQWQRDEEIMEQEGELKALPSHFRQARELRERQRAIRELQQQRQELDGPQELAASMAQLATILKELPGQLDETAKKFNEVYPEGTFTIELNIDIRTNAEDPNAIELDLGGGDSENAAESEKETEAPSQPDFEP